MKIYTKVCTTFFEPPSRSPSIFYRYLLSSFVFRDFRNSLYFCRKNKFFYLYGFFRYSTKRVRNADFSLWAAAIKNWPGVQTATLTFLLQSTRLYWKNTLLRTLFRPQVFQWLLDKSWEKWAIYGYVDKLPTYLSLCLNVPERFHWKLTHFWCWWSTFETGVRKQIVPETKCETTKCRQ